jgi:hypothetical protein
MNRKNDGKLIKEFEKMKERNMLHEIEKFLKMNNYHLNILKQEKFGETWTKV